jgi:hypothetical protein
MPALCAEGRRRITGTASVRRPSWEESGGFKGKMKESDHAAISQYHNNGKKKGLKIGRMAHHLRQKRTQAVTKHTGKVSDIWPPYRTYT